jgi:hypothetical protein
VIYGLYSIEPSPDSAPVRLDVWALQRGPFGSVRDFVIFSKGSKSIPVTNEQFAAFLSEARPTKPREPLFKTTILARKPEME